VDELLGMHQIVELAVEVESPLTGVVVVVAPAALAYLCGQAIPKSGQLARLSQPAHLRCLAANANHLEQ